MANPNKKPQPPSYMPALKSLRRSHSEPTTRLYRLLLIFFTLTALLGAYFSYRPVHKTRSNKWWSFGAGSSSVPRSSCDNSIEGKINDLAKAFGIPPRELASAIAVAVKNYAPPESTTISSLASGNSFSTAVPSLSVYDGSDDLVGTDDAA